MLDILLARPHHLDGPVHLLGDANGLDHHVGLETAAEATADDLVVHDHFVERHAGGSGGGRLHPCRDLRAEPELAGARRQMHRAIHRLHGGVRQEGHFVMRFDLLAIAQRLVGIADLFGDQTALLGWRP